MKPVRIVAAFILLVTSSLFCHAASDVRATAEATSHLTRLTDDGKSRAVPGLGFSPQGDYIAYFRRDETRDQLMVRTLEGKTVLTVGPAGSRDGPWSPDGTKIAYVYAENRDATCEARVYVWSLAANTSKEVALWVSEPSIRRWLWLRFAGVVSGLALVHVHDAQNDRSLGLSLCGTRLLGRRERLRPACAQSLHQWRLVPGKLVAGLPMDRVSLPTVRGFRGGHMALSTRRIPPEGTGPWCKQHDSGRSYL